MKFKLCVCDLDGTILNSESRISQEDLKALLKLKEKGIKLVVATGRTELQIFEYLALLETDTPVITCNGGVIKYRGGGKVIHRSVFGPGSVEKIVNHCFENNIDFLLYTTNFVYHCPGSERIKFFIEYNKTAKPEYRVPIKCTDELPKDDPYGDVTKILIHDNVDMIPDLNSKFNADGSLTIVTSGKDLIDVMPRHLKGKRACHGREKRHPDFRGYRVRRQPERREHAKGRGVRGCDETPGSIKKIADFVTKTNDEAGIAYALKSSFFRYIDSNLKENTNDNRKTRDGDIKGSRRSA